MAHEELTELRRSAFAIAYRMLGSVSEAEDVVQEGLLRLHQAREGGERIESPRAYLSTVVSRLGARPPALGAGPPRDLRGRLAARAPRRRRRGRSRRPGRDGRLAVARLPRGAREPLARAARGVPAARGVRRALQPDRGDRRHQRAERPPARGTGPPPCRGGAPALRGLARAARRARDPLLRRRAGGRPAGARAAAGPRCGAARRRRRQGSRPRAGRFTAAREWRAR